MKVILVILLLYASVVLADQTPLKNRYGNTIGSVDSNISPGKRFVKDCRGTLGWTTQNGTYDRYGTRVLEFPDIGYLLRQSACPNTQSIFTK